MNLTASSPLGLSPWKIPGVSLHAPRSLRSNCIVWADYTRSQTGSAAPAGIPRRTIAPAMRIVFVRTGRPGGAFSVSRIVTTRLPSRSDRYGVAANSHSLQSGYPCGLGGSVMRILGCVHAAVPSRGLVPRPGGGGRYRTGRSGPWGGSVSSPSGVHRCLPRAGSPLLAHHSGLASGHLSVNVPTRARCDNLPLGIGISHDGVVDRLVGPEVSVDSLAPGVEAGGQLIHRRPPTPWLTFICSVSFRSTSCVGRYSDGLVRVRPREIVAPWPHPPTAGFANSDPPSSPRPPFSAPPGGRACSGMPASLCRNSK